MALDPHDSQISFFLGMHGDMAGLPGSLTAELVFHATKEEKLPKSVSLALSGKVTPQEEQS